GGSWSAGRAGPGNGDMLADVRLYANLSIPDVSIDYGRKIHLAARCCRRIKAHSHIHAHDLVSGRVANTNDYQPCLVREFGFISVGYTGPHTDPMGCENLSNGIIRLDLGSVYTSSSCIYNGGGFMHGLRVDRDHVNPNRGRAGSRRARRSDGTHDDQQLRGRHGVHRP
ncbi:hypothetical protein BVRB_027900, partial [Beta vulgaris subsp. vulgaris]